MVEKQQECCGVSSKGQSRPYVYRYVVTECAVKGPALTGAQADLGGGGGGGQDPHSD